MNTLENNPAYNLKIDHDLFEYKIKNRFIRLLLGPFKISTQITLPMTLISELKIRKALIGHFVTLTITKYSTRRNTSTRKVRLRKFWVIRWNSLWTLPCPNQLRVSNTYRPGIVKHNIQIQLIDHSSTRKA